MKIILIKILKIYLIFYNQILLLITGNTPYNLMKQLKSLPNYNECRNIFRDNLIDYLLDIKNNQNHYLILLVLYTLGLLNDYELIDENIRISIINNYTKLLNDDNKDILIKSNIHDIIL